MNPFLRLFVVLVLLLGCGVQPSMAELSEGQVKAAYVYNFVKFVEWPPGAGGDKLTLCAVGSKVLGGALAGLDGLKAGGRTLHVVNLTDIDGRLNACQVVYVGESEQHRYVSLLKSLDDLPVLTISDIDDFAEKGGCIGLRYRENKIVFEVNLATAQQAGLRLPAQLLNLASYVFRR